MKYIFLLISVVFFSFDLKSQDFNVYIIISEECPICQYMGKEMGRIAEDYKDVANFYLVFPWKNSNYKKIHNFKEKFDLDLFESILDKDKSMTKSLGASVTPEAIITDANKTILYRGRINDAYYAPGKYKHANGKDDLRDALDNIKRSKPIDKPWPKAIGCFINI